MKASSALPLFFAIPVFSLPTTTQSQCSTKYSTKKVATVPTYTSTSTKTVTQVKTTTVSGRTTRTPTFRHTFITTVGTSTVFLTASQPATETITDFATETLDSTTVETSTSTATVTATTTSTPPPAGPVVPTVDGFLPIRSDNNGHNLPRREAVVEAAVLERAVSSYPVRVDCQRTISTTTTVIATVTGTKVITKTAAPVRSTKTVTKQGKTTSTITQTETSTLQETQTTTVTNFSTSTETASATETATVTETAPASQETQYAMCSEDNFASHVISNGTRRAIGSLSRIRFAGQSYLNSAKECCIFCAKNKDCAGTLYWPETRLCVLAKNMVTCDPTTYSFGAGPDDESDAETIYTVSNGPCGRVDLSYIPPKEDETIPPWP